MPITFDDQRNEELAREAKRKEAMKRNAIIVYVAGGAIICLIALGIAKAFGVL